LRSHFQEILCKSLFFIVLKDLHPNEFYRTAFRKKIYNSIEELQKDVDIYIKEYNEDRPHSGRFCYGKTPMQTFKDSKSIEDEKRLKNLQPNLKQVA
jgi:hypothetical protein